MAVFVGIHAFAHLQRPTEARTLTERVAPNAAFLAILHQWQDAVESRVRVQSRAVQSRKGDSWRLEFVVVFR